jgi:hypothetical protein
MAQESSGFRCGWLSHPFSLLIPAFALRFPPAVLPVRLPRYTRTLPYPVSDLTVAASVLGLSPGTLSARYHSTSELLRTLAMMAASKPTSWLSVQRHNLSH